MRDLLTLLAGLLVLVLTAALVGPYFVDWTAQRGFIEQRLSAALDAQVVIDGPVSLTLLPTPSLDVGRLSIASREKNGPSLSSERAAFELAVTPLMRGELQFLDADLERPAIVLHAAADGAMTLPDESDAALGQIGFENVTFTDATVTIVRAESAPVVLSHIDLSAHAEALAGPLAAAGVFHAASRSIRFNFATGTRAGNSIPLQAHLESEKSFAFDSSGDIVLTPRGAATQFSYQGDAALSGVVSGADHAPEAPWRASGAVKIDVAGFTLDKGALRIGPDNSVVEARLDAKYAFAPGSRAAVSIQADELDGDRLLTNLGEGSAADLIARGETVVAAGSPVAWPVAWPIDATIATPVLTLGGKTFADLSVAIGLGAAEVPTTVRVKGPGDSHAAFDGAVRTGAGARVRGRLDIAVGDVQGFADWIAPADADIARRMRALPWRSLSAKAQIDAAADDWRAADLAIGADGDVLKGTASFKPARGARRAEAALDLNSDALDIDSLPDLRSLALNGPDADLALAFTARTVRLAHFGQGKVDAGRIALHLHSTNGELHLDDLSLQGVGGATLTASGEASAAGAHFDASLDATRLVDLADVAQHAAPGVLSSALASRAAVLSPVRLTAHVDASRAANGAYRPGKVALHGSARGVRIDGSLDPSGDASQATLDLQADDSSILMRQLGFDTPPIADFGPGRITLRGTLDAAGALTGSARASVAGSTLDFAGEIHDVTRAPAAQGKFAFHSADAAPFLRLATLAGLDPTTKLPLSLTADASLKAGALSLTGVAGALDGDRLSGQATLQGASDGAIGLSGQLAFDRLALATILAQTLGAPSPPPAAGGWSPAAFSPGVAAPPQTDLLLHAKTFELAPGWIGADATAHLTLATDHLTLQNFAMSLGGGSMSGALDLRRSGSSVAATAQAALRDVDFNQPTFAGKMTGAASFATTGASPLELAQGFAGSGSLRMDGLRIERTAPDAVTRLLADVSDADGSEQVGQRLGRALDAGPLRLVSPAFDLQVAGGQASLSSKGSREATTLVFDLRDLSTTEKIVLTAPNPQDWPNPAPPTATVIWRTPKPGAPAVRSIEADALVGALATRAALREAAHIATLNQDIQERAFFQRRMKGLAFMRKRDAEVAAWLAEQKRLRKAAEAAALAAAGLQTLSIAPVGAAAKAPVSLVPDPLASGRF